MRLFEFTDDDIVPGIKQNCKQILKFYNQYQYPLFHGDSKQSLFNKSTKGYSKFLADREDQQFSDEKLQIPREFDTIWDAAMGEDHSVSRSASLFVSANFNIANGYGFARLVFPEDGWSWMTTEMMDIWEILTREGDNTFAHQAREILGERYHQAWPGSYNGYPLEIRQALADGFIAHMKKFKSKLGIVSGTDQELDKLAKAIRTVGNEVLLTAPEGTGFFTMHTSNILHANEFVQRAMVNPDLTTNADWKTLKRYMGGDAQFLMQVFPKLIQQVQDRVMGDAVDSKKKMVTDKIAVYDDIRKTTERIAKAGNWMLFKDTTNKYKTDYKLFKPTIGQPDVEVKAPRTMGVGESWSIDWRLNYNYTSSLSWTKRSKPAEEQKIGRLAKREFESGRPDNILIPLAPGHKTIGRWDFIQEMVLTQEDFQQSANPDFNVML